LPDLPREPIPDLGFSVDLWNGNYRRDGAELWISCGQYGVTAKNRAMVKLSPSEDGLPEPQYLLAILRALVEAWEPDVGEVFQLIPKGDDLDELLCAGYSLSRPMVGSGAQVYNESRGYIWMDEGALTKFI
jgi:hypothetical protein